MLGLYIVLLSCLEFQFLQPTGTNGCAGVSHAAHVNASWVSFSSSIYDIHIMRGPLAELLVFILQHTHFALRGSRRLCVQLGLKKKKTFIVLESFQGCAHAWRSAPSVSVAAAATFGADVVGVGGRLAAAPPRFPGVLGLLLPRLDT